MDLFLDVACDGERPRLACSNLWSCRPTAIRRPRFNYLVMKHQKWEYMKQGANLETDRGDIGNLNYFGGLGWQLVSVIAALGGNIYYFKRPIIEEKE
jgi:hypothetical protein